MTKTLIENLREHSGGIFTANDLCRQAADELERLQGELDAANQHVKVLQGQREAVQPRALYWNNAAAALLDLAPCEYPSDAQSATSGPDEAAEKSGESRG